MYQILPSARFGHAHGPSGPIVNVVGVRRIEDRSRMRTTHAKYLPNELVTGGDGSSDL